MTTRRMLVLAALAAVLLPMPALAQRADSASVVERAARAMCNRPVVVLGELPSHGEARGFQAKARIVEWLVDRCGFDALLFEAPVYGFVGLRSAIARGDATPAQLDKAIGRFWWTRELAGWRGRLFERASRGGLLLGGLDDQLSITSEWASATLPRLVAASLPASRAAECEQAVTRHLYWRYDAAHPNDEAEQARLQRCARDAAAAAASRTPPANAVRDTMSTDSLLLANFAGYVDRQRGAPGARDRDEAMYRNVLWHVARMPAGSKVIVWTATVHAARQQGRLAERPLGARLAERWGQRVGALGFTALGGRSAMAGGPGRPLPELPSASLEARALHAGSGWAYLDAKALRRLGASPSRMLKEFAPADWSAYFDGVVVIRDEVAPTFEKW